MPKKKLVQAEPPDDLTPKEEAKWRRERDRYELMSSMYEDLPDGAYFAAMEEAGFDSYDHMEFSDKKVEA